MSRMERKQKEMSMVNEQLGLSEKSKDFLENLRLYLFSSGKNSGEIKEIVEELEVHLYEAEQNGKSVEKIIGNSPKEYMEMISDEMTIDYKTSIKYICLIIFGSFSFRIFPDLLEGNLSYSVLEIAGHIVIGAIFVASIIIGFKYLSTRKQTFKKIIITLIPIMVLPIALFVGLLFLNHSVETPMIQFGHTGSLIVAAVTGIFLIGVSIWAKTWVMVVVVALLTLPDYFLSMTSLSDKMQLMISPWITFAGIAIYLWISFKLEKKRSES